MPPEKELIPLGHVHFDTPAMRNFISEFLITQEMADQVFRNKYVKIDCGNRRVFLGRVVEGPFFIPEEVDRNSAFAQTSVLKGSKFPVVPNYYALGRVELIWELDKDGKLQATNTRPTPKSPVLELKPKEVQQIVGLEGSMRIGRLLGYENVVVMMDADNKKVLPRNIGIFGTVGAGKTNTAQVVIEESSAGGYAVIVVDIEGEYINMDKPSDELADKRASFGVKAEGLQDFWVYYPVAGECKRPKAIAFDIPFSTMDPFILAEILNFTEAQQRAYWDLIDRLQAKTAGRKEKEEEKSVGMRFLTGAPEEEEEGAYTLQDAFKTLFGEVIEQAKGSAKISGYTLASKFKKLNRARIFDQKGVAELPVLNLLKPRRVNVIDVSGCDEDVKNIVIAWLLDKVFRQKLREPEKTPKTLVLIEEAHTFVSRENRERMLATLDMVKTIARRGRKRWLCLGFISQQPSHLPNEIFELCNTRIIHSIKSEYNLQALKSTGGDIIEEVWNQIPGLGVGQAIISSPQYNHAIQVDIRPAKTKRELVT